MKYGLTESELQLLDAIVIAPLKKKNAEIFLFGSRARSQHKKFSDVDLVYISCSEQAIPNHMIYQITSELEESDFPYKLDLVKYEELATSYKKNIELEKIKL